MSGFTQRPKWNDTASKLSRYSIHSGLMQRSKWIVTASKVDARLGPVYNEVTDTFRIEDVAGREPTKLIVMKTFLSRSAFATPGVVTAFDHRMPYKSTVARSLTHWTTQPFAVNMLTNTTIDGLPRVPYAASNLSLVSLAQSSPAMIAILLGLVAVFSIVVSNSKKPKPPLANPPRWNQTTLSRRIEFLKNGRAILSDARKRYGKQPYRLIVDTGECLILPPEYAATIRNSMDLSFAQAIEKNFSGHVSGFEMYAVLLHEQRLVQNVVKDQLTKYLSKKQTTTGMM